MYTTGSTTGPATAEVADGLAAGEEGDDVAMVFPFVFAEGEGEDGEDGEDVDWEDREEKAEDDEDEDVDVVLFVVLVVDVVLEVEVEGVNVEGDDVDEPGVSILKYWMYAAFTRSYILIKVVAKSVCILTKASAETTTADAVFWRSCRSRKE